VWGVVSWGYVVENHQRREQGGEEMAGGTRTTSGTPGGRVDCRSIDEAAHVRAA
jgi:hypothetical protein